MRVYPHYRDSGVEWLGEVPEHWEVRRLEHVAAYRTSNVDKKTADGELPVRLCNYTDVYYGDRIRAGEGEFMPATASAGEVERFKLRVGDVLITKDSEDWRDIAVPAVVDETADDFVCGYHLGIIRSGPETDPFFLYRAMQSGAVNRQLQTSASGVTRYGLPNAAVGDVLLPLPPHDEQRAIAAFLDRETERIDSLIAKKRLLMERLREYRTALITRTVTRGLPPAAARAAGLDPSPRLKPSGVEWLGDVPEHWAIGRFSREVDIAEGQVNPEAEPFASMLLIAPNHIESGTGQLMETHTSAEQGAISGKYLCRHGEVIYSKIRPALAKVTLAPTDCLCSADMYPMRTRRSLMNEYLYWLLLSKGFTIWSVLEADRVAMPKINRETLSTLRLPLPPISEQRALTDYLRLEIARLGRLQSRIGTAIERLDEMRAALVTSAVTGKIDVRETTRTATAGLESLASAAER